MPVFSSHPRFMQSRMAISIAAVLLFGQAAQATVVIDPDGTGATRVFPNLETNPVSTSQINVGYSGVDGTVEINAESSGNGITAVAGSGLLVGRELVSGEVRIIGDGNAGSAQATINDGIGARIGFGGEGTLRVESGGLLQSNENVHFGEDSLTGDVGTTTVVIDGPGSVVRSAVSGPGSFRDGGRVYIPFQYADVDVTVSNGGRIEAIGGNLAENEDGAIYIGEEFAPANVAVTVTDPGSAISAQHGIYIRQGFGGGVTLDILNGARVEVTDTDVGSSFPFASAIFNALDGNANVNVSGASSQFDAAGDVQIGSNRAIAGFTSSGQPSYSVDFDALAVGVQAATEQGELLFDQNGDPVVGVEQTFGTFTVVVPSSYADGNEIYVKANAAVSVADGGALLSGGDITIGQNSTDPVLPAFGGGDSTLTVGSGGTVTAQTVRIEDGGRLKGDGGVIDADVVVDGGTVAPGASPGTMQILGSLDVLTGVLELEADSELNKDLLIVGGDVNIGPDAMIQLVLGYLPDMSGIQIESFFDVTGAFNVDSMFDPLSNILLSFTAAAGVQEGDMVEVGFGNETITYRYSNGQTQVVTNDGSVPVPATIILMICGMILSRRIRHCNQCD